MEVACGKCGARGRVPDAQLAGGPVAVRCSVCRGVMHVGEAPKPARADAWYLDSGQGAHGPYKIDELVALWRSDKISWNAKLWRDGDPEWSPARGHGAFIDAIFKHDDERAAASGGAATGSAGVPLPPADRAARPGARLPPVPAQRPHGDRTSPAYVAAAAAAELAAVSAEAERTPHDSLAPFERVSRVAGRRWPLAIMLGSGALAGGVLLWALDSQPAAPVEAALSPAPVASPVRAAAAAAPPAPAQLVNVAASSGAIEAPTAVPAAEANVAASEAALAEAQLHAAIPAARARPLAAVPAVGNSAPALRGGAGARARSNALAEPPAADGEADDEAVEEASDAQPALAAADEPQPAPAAPAPRRTSDFLTAAEPLPDMPTTREIASAMRKAAPAVRACGESSASSTVFVSVVITGATGRVARVQVPQVDGDVQTCIRTAVREVTFPAFARPELELRFPFLIGQ